MAEGPPSGAPFDPAKVRLTRVGTVELYFSARDEAWLRYEAFGTSATRRITRQPL